MKKFLFVCLLALMLAEVVSAQSTTDGNPCADATSVKEQGNRTKIR